jgi:hypothetical protein
MVASESGGDTPPTALHTSFTVSFHNSGIVHHSMNDDNQETGEKYRKERNE